MHAAVGRKVTGDVHVPMGANTFVALLEPSHLLGAVVSARSHLSRRTRARGGVTEPVVRAWPGFGTLSFPGFQSPSWDSGWLVQLEDDASGTRFAFIWASRQVIRPTFLPLLKRSEQRVCRRG